MKRVPPTGQPPASTTQQKPPANRPTPAPTPAPAGSQLPALVGGNLDTIGGYVPGEVPLPEPTGAAYIGFWNKKSGKAAEIIQALGSVADGHPYLAAAGLFFNMAPLAFTVLAATRYWACVDDENNLTWASLEEQPFGRQVTVGGRQIKVKDSVMALLLVMPGSQALPEDLQPATVAVCDFRGTKSPATLDHLREIEKAMTPEFAQKNGEMASRVPPRFRVASMFRIESKPGKQGGFGYSMAKANTATTTIPQLEAVAAWHATPECQEEFALAQSIYTSRLEDLKAFAAQAGKGQGQ